MVVGLDDGFRGWVSVQNAVKSMGNKFAGNVRKRRGAAFDPVLWSAGETGVDCQR